MRIAYIISAYKNPQQLVRLVHRLHTGTSSFFIHMDKRATGEVYREAVTSLSGLPDVHFLDRHRCYWGGFGHVEATIKGLRALVDSKPAFDYAVLLTGQDYPIKPNGYIENVFRNSGAKIYMEYFPLPYGEWERGGLDRIQYWHFRPLAAYCRSIARYGYDAQVSGTRGATFLSLTHVRRRFPRGFTPFGGSSYWCLPRSCVEYLHDFIERNPAFVRFFKYVDVPDEIFFQTIVLNSPLRDYVVDDNLRYIDWKDPNSASPAVLGTGDFDRIRRSSKLFARKFDVTIDADILSMIDREILSGEVTTSTVNWSP